MSLEAQTAAIGRALKDIYNQPENGLIRSSFPSVMSVRQVSTVIVEIQGAEVARAHAALSPLQNGDVYTEIMDKLRVSTTMSVFLTAQTPEAFEISSVDNSTNKIDLTAKSLASNGSQQWKWAVAPLRSGSQMLYVTAYISVPIPGQTVPPLQVYQKTQVITVPVVPFYKRFWWAARDALQTNWLDLLKWSWTALIVPVALWAWKKTRPKKQRRKSKRKLFRMKNAVLPKDDNEDVPTNKVS